VVERRDCKYVGWDEVRKEQGALILHPLLRGVLAFLFLIEELINISAMILE
jgi:hypothetical protein